MSETDLQLLARYARHKAEDAFAEVVRRHVDLVYSSALRQVRSPQVAEEVVQSTFLKLARHADGLARDTIVAAWLYEVARREAIDATRREARRQVREQTAFEMNAIHANAADWLHIEPLLDEAMHALDDADRAAVLLRYFENRSLREVGQALGTSDDAAQKRVSRAVERLKDFFSKRGVTAGAAGLGAVISVHAVQAAPAGLGAAVSAAAIAGSAVHTSTALAVTKTIAMTTMQKTVVGAALAISVGTGIYEAHEASAFRQQAESLQQQQAALADQVREVSVARDAAVEAAAASRSEVDAAQRSNVELLRLRSEVAQLQQQLVKMRAGGPPMAATQAVLVQDQSDQRIATDKEMAELGLAASRGDVSALDKLAEFSMAALKGRTNTNQPQDTHRDIRVAFNVMGEEAGKGNETALQMLWRATRTKGLQGMATMALGQAAGMGNEKALEPLLDPEKYLLLPSSVVSALRPAAENGNERAIQAIAAVAGDPKKQAMWWQVATYLEKPAEAGNAVAIDALNTLARTENPNVRRAALLSLEKAAFKGHVKATDALRSLGYQ